MKTLKTILPLIALIALIFAEPARGQTAAAAAPDSRLTLVHVAGDAVVREQPDTAVLSVSVVTQSKSAQQAQAENADRSDAVIRAVKAAAGPSAEVKTGGYALTPQRAYKENQPPTVTGYEARNSVVVTLGDLSKVGAAIDAATGAGANSIGSLSFTLRDDRAARERALSEATKEAVEKARAVARSLGTSVVRVVEVKEEGTSFRPVYMAQAADYASVRAAPAAPTPIEVGELEVRAQVRLTAEAEPRR